MSEQRQFSEQSHKAQMADALRGDFERLRARGVASTLDSSTSPPIVRDKDSAFAVDSTTEVQTARPTAGAPRGLRRLLRRG